MLCKMVLGGAVSLTVASTGLADQCSGIFRGLQSQAPGDVRNCTQEVIIKETEEHKSSQTHIADNLQSQIVLTLDASGSLEDNTAKINLAYQHTKTRLTRCVHNEINTKGRLWIIQKAEAILNEEDKSCLPKIRTLAARASGLDMAWLSQRNDALEAERLTSLEKLDAAQTPVAKPPPNADPITDVGIRFAQMPVGTVLTISLRGALTYQVEQEYLGIQNGFQVMQVRKINDDGSRKDLSKIFFNAAGQRVYSERRGKQNTYEPYDCRYALGVCETTHTYFNSLKATYVSNASKYINRIEGNTLYVGTFDATGEMYEVPFTLGPFNLRVSNEYKNALGRETGFSFVSLNIPE